ncbi:hypothetical protein BaRGS_00000153 [Batillaria attramentaria]|uniref:Uncharacterized protein n=1 Tax=Batillaria attramentaria TaxID=370345 RepID=A0ABD0MBI3_9CAEN
MSSRYLPTPKLPDNRQYKDTQEASHTLSSISASVSERREGSRYELVLNLMHQTLQPKRNDFPGKRQRQSFTSSSGYLSVGFGEQIFSFPLPLFLQIKDFLAAGATLWPRRDFI